MIKFQYYSYYILRSIICHDLLWLIGAILLCLHLNNLCRCLWCPLLVRYNRKACYLKKCRSCPKSGRLESGWQKRSSQNSSFPKLKRTKELDEIDCFWVFEEFSQVETTGKLKPPSITGASLSAPPTADRLQAGFLPPVDTCDGESGENLPWPGDCW